MLKIEVTTPNVVNNVVFGENVELSYLLYDASYSLCDLSVEYSINSGLTWNACTPNLLNPLHENPANLTSSPSGVKHFFVWESPTDIPSTGSVRIRIQATNLPSNQAITDLFQVDNIHAIVLVATPDKLQTGSFTIGYTVYNYSGDDADIVCYYSKDGGYNWWEAKEDVSIGDGVENLSTSVDGDTHLFGWDSAEDIPVGSVYVKIEPSNSSTSEIGYSGSSEEFFVNNTTSWLEKKVPFTLFALDPDDVLKFYINILDFERAHNTEITTSLIELLDPLKCPEQYLNVLGDTLGVRLDGEAPTDIKRRQIASAVLWYKEKGTLSAFEAFFMTLGYKIDVYEVTTDGKDCDTDFVSSNWYKTARLRLTFLKYDDDAWIEPWETEELMSLLEEVRPIHDLITTYNWGFDFSEVLLFDDDNEKDVLVDRLSYIADEWINPPLEIELFDAWFGDGILATFAGIIPLPAGVQILPESLQVFATGVGNQPMIGTDDGLGIIDGAYIINGTIDYVTGSIFVLFGVAPDIGAEVTIKYSLDSSYYSYPIDAPHHYYTRDGNSLLVRDRAWLTQVAPFDVTVGVIDSVGTLLPATASRMGVLIDIFQTSSNRKVATVCEYDNGNLRNVENVIHNDINDYLLLANTVGGVPVYGGNLNNNVIPSSVIMSIDELWAYDDGNGVLSGSGNISGVPTDLTGTITYDTGAISVTLNPAPGVAGIPININYKTYEYFVTGTGGAMPAVLYTTDFTNIEPGTVRIFSRDGELASDDTVGNITGSGITGTINYATGAMNLSFASSVLNWNYGVQYRIYPLRVDEGLSRLNRGMQSVIATGDGVSTIFRSTLDPNGVPVSLGSLLSPIPILPGSFYVKSALNSGRSDTTQPFGNVVGSITGTIEWSSGFYELVFAVAPADGEEIVAGWESNYLNLVFEQPFDQSLYNVQVRNSWNTIDSNYDQANSHHYTRDSYNYSYSKPFIGREGHAHNIGIGDGFTPLFTGTLPNTPVLPNSVTVLVWCENKQMLPHQSLIPVQVLAYDDGANNIIGMDDDLAPVWGTINYLTGAITVNFSFGNMCVPISGANVVVHYSTQVDGALQEIGWNHWKKKGSRLSILRNSVLFYNG